MKKVSWVEKAGLVLMVLGLVFMIINDVWEDSPIAAILERHQLFLWGGLVIWALGSLQKPKVDR